MVQPSSKRKTRVSIAKTAQKIELVVFDFDGVLTDNLVLVFSDGTEAVFCSREDSWGINLLRQNDINVGVISTETNPVVAVRCKKMNIACFQGCYDKLTILKKNIKIRGLDLSQVAYLGNDTNDLECIKAVGLGACVGDAHRSVIKSAKYITKKNGGHGAVREFCDLILKHKTGR